MYPGWGSDPESLWKHSWPNFPTWETGMNTLWYQGNIWTLIISIQGHKCIWETKFQNMGPQWTWGWERALKWCLNWVLSTSSDGFFKTTFYLFGSFFFNEVIVDLFSLGSPLLWWLDFLEVFTGQPEIDVLLAELWFQKSSKSCKTIWGARKGRNVWAENIPQILHFPLPKIYLLSFRAVRTL